MFISSLVTSYTTRAHTGNDNSQNHKKNNSNHNEEQAQSKKPERDEHDADKMPYAHSNITESPIQTRPDHIRSSTIEVKTSDHNINCEEPNLRVGASSDVDNAGNKNDINIKSWIFGKCHDQCCQQVKKIYKRFGEWYKFHFGPDTKNWFILLSIRELMEIATQVFAAYNYNGLNLLGNDKNRITLAAQEGEIKIFCSLLSLNCIFTGILWLFYIFSNQFCSGAFFKQLIFFVDTIFDTFYALFPIIVVISQKDFDIDLQLIVAVLQTPNTTQLLAILIPMTYLVLKCLYFLYTQRKKLFKIYKGLQFETPLSTAIDNNDNNNINDINDIGDHHDNNNLELTTCRYLHAKFQCSSSFATS